MTKIQRIITVLFFLIILFSKRSIAVEPVVLQLRWHHGFQFAGYYMAKEKGFYQEVGLHVTIAEGGVTIDQFDQVLHGQAHYGVASSELIIQYLKGKPFQSMGVIFQHSPYSLMVRKDSGLNNPHQLVGKTVYIGLIPRTAEIHAMLIHEGVSFDKLHVIDAVTSSPDYTNPDIDAFSVYETNEPFLLKQQGIETDLIKPINYGIDFYGDCLFSTTQELTTHSERSQLFLQASLKGWQYAFAHPEETIALVLSKYNTDNKSRDHLRYEYDAMRQLILPEYIPLGQQNQFRWERIAQTYAELGMAPTEQNIPDFIYDPQRDNARKLQRYQRISLLVMMVVSVLALLLYFWNRTLKVLVRRKTQSLHDEIVSHRTTQKKLKVALTKYQTLFNSFPLGITVSDEAGNIIETNWAAEKFLAVSKPEQEKRAIDGQEWKIVRPDGTLMPPREYASVKALQEKRTIENVELGIVTSHDDIIWLNVTAAPLPLEGYGVVVTYGDITDRKQAEDRLKSSLAEKETLLRELYHRTKNTLQVIRSMLLLQAARMPDNEQVQKLVTETENRIMAIALVHQKLYQSQDLSRIPMQEYLEGFVQLIMQSSTSPPQNISVVVESEPIALLLDTAIPCGLIINELLTNALKYAFPDHRQGEIVIRLVRTGSTQLELTVADNGIGIPPGFDFREQQTLGLQTVIAIAEHQMQGTINFVSEQGVTCTVEFSDALYHERV